MWYAAHAVMLIRLKSGEQSDFPIWENVLLIQADTPHEAYEKAEERAKKDESEENNTDTWNGEPFRFEFLGLRKLNQCFWDGEESQPSDGDEVTYNQITFADREQLDKFVAGDEAQLTIDDERPWR